jgi:hypothetical protein
MSNECKNCHRPIARSADVCGTCIDPLSQPATVGVVGSKLQPGMVLVDDLGCPAAFLESRDGRARDSVVTFMVYDLDTGKVYPHGFHVNKTFQVLPIKFKK